MRGKSDGRINWRAGEREDEGGIGRENRMKERRKDGNKEAKREVEEVKELTVEGLSDEGDTKEGGRVLKKG